MAFSRQVSLRALDDIVALVGERADFAAVELTVDDEINVLFTEESAARRVTLDQIPLERDDGTIARVPVYERLGHRPVDFAAPFDPDFVGAGPPYMGGDRCHNSGEAYQGTLGFFSNHMVFEQSGQCNVVFDVTRGLISNNHVLARSDRAKIGEPVWIQEPSNETARLSHVLPLRCNADLAFAEALDWGSVKPQQIRGIGWLRCTDDGYLDVRMPNLGEGILKYGITTGLTAGTVEAIVSFPSDTGHYYRGMYRTSRGFTCPGDSGSAVVSEENALLGLIAWGDSRVCADDPHGFFFPLVRKRGLADDDVPVLEARYEGPVPIRSNNTKGAAMPVSVPVETGTLNFETFHLAPDAQPQGLARDLRGNTWFSCDPSTIGYIRADGTRRFFPRDAGLAIELVAAADGTIWFGDTALNRIGRIAPDGTYLEPWIDLPKRFSPLSGCAGADGRMWFCSSRTRQIVAVAADGAAAVYSGIQPHGLVARDDHLLCLSSRYLAQWGYDGELGGLVELPDGANAFALVDGRSGEVWFLDEGRQKLCRFDGQALTDFAVPAMPITLAVTGDGSVWGTLDGAVESDRKLMRLAPDGSITLFAGPSRKSVLLKAIADERDGLWLCDYGRGKIVRASLA